jgi:hypothetical protein
LSARQHISACLFLINDSQTTDYKTSVRKTSATERLNSHEK